MIFFRIFKGTPSDLPAIDFSYSPGPAHTSSPPPGRPGRDASRKRPKSSDEEDDVPKKQKSDKKDSTGNEKKGEKHNLHSLTVTGEIEAVDNCQNPNLTCISKNPIDAGKFTALEAYSPMSPAKTKSIPDLSVLVNSPVYHSKFGKK